MKKRNTFEQSQGESLGHSCNCGRLVNIEAVCPLLKNFIKDTSESRVEPLWPYALWYYAYIYTQENLCPSEIL